MHESGYSIKEIGAIHWHRNLLGMVIGYGGSGMILITNYYSGKKYKLRKKSTLVFLLALIIAIWVGYLVGYGIRQLELPEYPILSFHFFFRTLKSLQIVILWSLIGMLAANYRHELKKTSSPIQREETIARASPYHLH